MNREIRLSDKARKMIEKQLELLSDPNDLYANADTALAILKLVEVLERDDQLRERDARLADSFEYECECAEARMLAKQREIELEEERKEDQIRRIRFVLRVFGITLFCSLFISFFVWLLL